MGQRVSMEDIARQLNVSRATVSYVLNGQKSNLISASTRERVLATAREMGYRPNRAAQSLKGGPTYLIELCVNGFHPAFRSRVLHAFEKQIGPTPYQLHIINPLHTREEDWTASGGGWQVDGLIISDAYFPETAMPSLMQRDVPMVAVGVYANRNIDHVFVDLSAALLEAMRHLAARGRRIAYLSPWDMDKMLHHSDLRYPTYRKVMEEARLREEIIVAPDQGDRDYRDSTREILRDYVTKNGCPDAIFCFNDDRAIAALVALRDLNLRVPQDVMLIGCDGIEDTTYHYPAISTIQYPYDEAARMAWEFLSRRMAHSEIPLQSAILTAPLVLRESSAR